MKYPSKYLFPSPLIYPEKDEAANKKIEVSDFTTLKTAINILMAKRKYNPAVANTRPMNSYTVTANVTRGNLLKPAEMNNLYAPYQRMISSDANNAPAAAVKTGEVISKALYETVKNFVTKYSDFNVYHNNQTDSGCGGYCSGLCVTVCANACKSTCTGGCGSNCQSGCSGGCSVLCSGCTGCTGSCAISCVSCSGCGSGCIYACSQKCAEACDADCDGKCFTDCGSSCEFDECEYCCYSNCVGECDGSCTDTCDGSCSGDCDTGSKSSSCSCSYKCMSGCTGTCNNGCKGWCDTSCKGWCDSACQNSCSVTGCQGECRWGCYGRNASYVCGSFCVSTCSISFPCEGSCTAGCYGICGGVCTTMCSAICGYSCAAGCTGQAMQYDWEPVDAPFGHTLPLARSTTITIGTDIPLPSNKKIYIFAVGGGGGSAGNYISKYDEDWYSLFGTGGGGGGYTNAIEITVKVGDRIRVDIGTGGPGGAASENVSSIYGGNGNPTRVWLNDTLILTASGGYAGGVYFDANGVAQKYRWAGGYGGSGGGAANPDYNNGSRSQANNGGYDGSDGRNWHHAVTYTAKGQRSFVPAGVESNRSYQTCIYNKVTYGAAGGGGGAFNYDGGDDSSGDYTYAGARYFAYKGGNSNGGGHGEDGTFAGENCTAGINGRGSGGGGRRTGWQLYNASQAHAGMRGGDGCVIIAY